jgi:hypothetical protein
VFVQVGAWASLEQLEESLILHELFLLYRACSNEFSKNMKALAASQGADVDFEEDWYAPEDRAPIDAMRSWDIMNAAIGLGYSEES